MTLSHGPDQSRTSIPRHEGHAFSHDLVMVKNGRRLITIGLVFIASLLLPTMVSAKDAKDTEMLHVLGVVTDVDANHIDVKTAKGPVVSVLFGKQVKFKNKSNPKSFAPPTVGDRVIIEASKDDKTKKVTAIVVHYSPIRTATPPR